MILKTNILKHLRGQGTKRKVEGLAPRITSMRIPVDNRVVKQQKRVF